MITINKSPNFGGFCGYKSEITLDFRGLSTDQKPEKVPNGSTFLEIDTGNVFCYDKGGKRWISWG